MQIWWEEDQWSNSCFLAFVLTIFRAVRRNVIFGHMYRGATLFCVQIGPGLRGRLWDHSVACVAHLLLVGDPMFVDCTVVSRTGVVPLDVARAHRELRITALIQLVSWTVDTQQTQRTARLDTPVTKEV